MAQPILMPKPGQMTEECVLVAWHKQEGDEVRKGDVIFEIETDKSVMDVESFDDGVLLKRYVEEGETVPVNTVCAYVGQPGEEVPDERPMPAIAAGPEGAESPAPADAPQPVAASVATETAPVPASAPSGGTGGNGRGDGRLAISPRASRLAAEAGIDPRTLTGSGPGGRITERDVKAAMAAPAATPASAASGSAAAPTAPAASAPAPVAGLDVADEEAPVPLSRMRRVIAERLSWSASTIPHFTVTVAVDMTRLVVLRAELKDAGTNLSVTDFVLAATAQTLAEFPDVNSRTDGQQVWIRRRVHLGLAVALPAGLVVPVIRDADRLALVELHDRAAELARAAREGTLPLDDMTGSTFTVSNLGMLGVDEFSAIINPGEAAILAVSSIVPTPMAIGDGIAVRQVMKLTLSADHRLVDGELAARFLNAVRRRLQDGEAFRGEALNA